MKKTKPKTWTLLATTLIAGQVLLSTPLAFAQDTTTSETVATASTTNQETSQSSGQSEKIQINAVALGNALTKEQQDYTLNKLGIKGETPIYTTNGTDLMNYIPDGGFNQEWAVYSSVRMQTLADGKGINVDIATPENITKITAAQYQNAALTAGITDAQLTIASAVPIDGSGALAGVYKIVEESGGIINKDRVEVAQDEMNVLSSITEENKDKEGYSDEALNAAQEQAKAELATKTKDGQKLTKEEIQQTVETALKDHGLADIMTTDQVSELTSLMSDMKDKNIFEEFVNELDLTETKKQIEEKSKGLWAQIKNFFSGLWDSITSMFE
ncbi:DUF1002 domain-containing protein [Enterococcus thailandicus]|uniref:DUF1002 domain-containing protein n=1 Tax=Enterococcus thailandicus TaxID=417368 RepID=UPI0022EBC9A9|nr:DUF1002 domain-containing protein [Enterococcus thailandicus]MDA3973996.1 DUF1002 domain-containing protein [Enterococcus thailandicus]MDA3976194.1 DUF1002 domain-containing protein [Enterococcus thailandicus]MDA3981159.1 DUF1002 domain-containing protein [Enterococcus thailandicus]